MKSLENGNQVIINQDGGQVTVSVDGVEIVGLKSVSFESEAQFYPTVTISLYPKITRINKEEI